MPEIGAPITPARSVAVMNDAIIRARSRTGHQRVRKKIMPGKKPASAAPSSSRAV